MKECPNHKDDKIAKYFTQHPSGLCPKCRKAKIESKMAKKERKKKERSKRIKELFNDKN